MSKMSLDQFLILKLGEEAGEVAEESLKLVTQSFTKAGMDESTISYTDLLGEYGDMFAVVDLLNEKTEFAYDFGKHDSKSNEEVIVAKILETIIPFEQACLVLLSRTCLQIDKLCKKTIQFGQLERHPDLPLNNKERIQAEIDHLRSIVYVLEKTIGQSFSVSAQHKEKKRKMIGYYLNYSISLGIVEDGANVEFV